MKAVLDACVLYPSVLREILQGVAAKGLFEPLWSDRILGEWTRATAKLGPLAQAQSEMEAAQFRAAFPRGFVREHLNIEARLALPDVNDVHVFAVAIAGNADCIITFNAKDFPRHLLAEEGVERRDPDGFLWQLWSFHPAEVTEVVSRTHAKAESILGEPIELKKLLKRAQLPRLAKAMLSAT